MNRAQHSSVFAVHCAVLMVVALVASLAAVCAAQNWPREIETAKGKVVVYQPQIESFSGDKLEARAAVSITRAGETAPVFGAVWVECRVSTDYDERLVKLLDLKVTNAKFPDAEPEHIEALSGLLESEIPAWDMDISLDRLLAGLDAVGMEKTEAEKINTAPPKIYFRTSPAVLVLIDGYPIMQDVPDSKLKYVANTPFFIIQNPSNKTYYLKGGEYWYTTKDVTGNWKETEDVPKDIVELAEKSAQEEEEPDTSFVGGPPEIIVSTEPAELILADGEPEYAPIEGTQLLYMSNTESDIIMDIESQTYYVLLAGRWYISKDPAAGDWTYVAHDKLPEDFPKIPSESDMGSVLVSVPGTQEAKDAVLENQIPQTAEVDRKTATVEVQYDGDPEFEKCGEKGVAYAKNCDKTVLLIDKRYYCCDDAVWFESGGPEGPWEVSVEVPDEVQSIPPECPAYNVKYVYIYESTPEVVYVGYTPGYTCSYVYGGVIVYGTGYWYRPWYHHYYYPRPVTWGFSVHYNPYTGWGFSFGFHAGWFGYGWHRPYYGGWWGPAGYRAGYRHGYYAGYHRGYYHGARAGYAAGVRAGYAAGTRPSTYQTANRNIYKNRATGVRNTGAVSARPATRPGTTPTVGTRPSPTVSPSIKNDVFADRNGNVHRKTATGWETRDKGGWTSPDRASQAKKQSFERSNADLNRHSQARDRGTQRTSNYQSYQQTTQRSRPSSTPQQRQQPRQQPRKSTGRRR